MGEALVGNYGVLVAATPQKSARKLCPQLRRPASAQRECFKRYLEGLLLPAERNKTLTTLANTESVVDVQHKEVGKRSTSNTDQHLATSDAFYQTEPHLLEAADYALPLPQAPHLSLNSRETCYPSNTKHYRFANR
jgi:hypothetical protein